MKYYFAYCQGDILLTTEGNVPFGDTPPIPLQPWNHITTLLNDSDEQFIVRLDNPILNIEGLQMVPLRKSYQMLSPYMYALAGKGAELVYWDSNTHYCGVCGAPTKWETAISKRCTNCGKELWPSIAPAIIVRIKRQDKILLVRAHSFRDRHYGLVAGFVETGETLEECVHREVWEETHLRICNIRYFGSQPWPYPCGLMIGFTADYLDGEVHVQKQELRTAEWFSKNNLPLLPDKLSIARQLIDNWLEEEEKSE